MIQLTRSGWYIAGFFYTKLNIMIPAIIISLHFLFDWILQPRKIAVNKKKYPKLLGYHLLFQILPCLILISIILTALNVQCNYPMWITINMLAHGFIDWFLPGGKTNRALINWTAADQIMHLSILFLTFEYFYI